MTKPLSSNENEKVLYTSAHPSYFCPMWTYHTRTWSVYVVLTRLDNCDCCSHLNLWPSEARRQCGKTKGVNFHLGTVYTIHVWWNWQWCLVTNPNFKIVSDSENTQDSGCLRTWSCAKAPQDQSGSFGMSNLVRPRPPCSSCEALAACELFPKWLLFRTNPKLLFWLYNAHKIKHFQHENKITGLFFKILQWNISWLTPKLTTAPGWPHGHVSAADSGCDPSDVHVMVATSTGAHIMWATSILFLFWPKNNVVCTLIAPCWHGLLFPHIDVWGFCF
jgi:hypothetical protein